MKVIDNTRGKRPTSREEFSLTVELKTGSRFVAYGQTKKEAKANYISKHYDFKGIKQIEWVIEDK